jgi:hypothetical protein
MNCSATRVFIGLIITKIVSSKNFILYKHLQCAMEEIRVAKDKGINIIKRDML